MGPPSAIGLLNTGAKELEGMLPYMVPYIVA